MHAVRFWQATKRQNVELGLISNTKQPSYGQPSSSTGSLQLLLLVKRSICTFMCICQTARSMERSIFFFLKSHISAPGAQNSPIFFPSVIYPRYLHVIIDFGHIWGPFMAEIEKMCQKSAFLVVPDFGYSQILVAFVRKWWT